MRRMPTFILLITIGLSIISCQNADNGNTGDTITEKKEKTLYIPENLALFDPQNDGSIDSLLFMNSDRKIYVSVNSSCSTCFDQISLWKDAIEKNSTFKIPVIIILNSKDQFELFKYLFEKNIIPALPYPYVLDYTNEFEVKNEVNGKAFLTDAGDVVLFSKFVGTEKDVDEFIRKANAF